MLIFDLRYFAVLTGFGSDAAGAIAAEIVNYPAVRCSVARDTPLLFLLPTYDEIYDDLATCR